MRHYAENRINTGCNKVCPYRDCFLRIPFRRSSCEGQLVDRDIQRVPQFCGQNENTGVVNTGAHMEYRRYLEGFAYGSEIIAGK